MNKKKRFSENRSIARMYRSTKNAILEMHANTLAYRAVEVSYEQWTKTPEYRKEVDRLREIVRRIREDFGEDIEFIEPE